MRNQPDLRQPLTARHAELSERRARIEHDQRRAAQPLESDFEEQVTVRENDEVLDALDHSLRAEIAQLEATLARLDKGEYGLCAGCGKRIPQKRLQALPQATRGVACAAAS